MTAAHKGGGMEEAQHFVVERLQQASIWSDDTMLECRQDGQYMTFTISQGAQTLTIRLTTAQWQELREAWNRPQGEA
jgi:hypothetical protein